MSSSPKLEVFYELYSEIILKSRYKGLLNSTNKKEEIATDWSSQNYHAY